MSRKRLISRFLVVATVITAVTIVGAGSALAGSVTMTAVNGSGQPLAPQGDNGWYLDTPGLKIDWVTQNFLPNNGLGYHEQVRSGQLRLLRELRLRDQIRRGF